MYQNLGIGKVEKNRQICKLMTFSNAKKYSVHKRIICPQVEKYYEDKYYFRSTVENPSMWRAKVSYIADFLLHGWSAL